MQKIELRLTRPAPIFGFISFLETLNKFIAVFTLIRRYLLKSKNTVLSKERLKQIWAKKILNLLAVEVEIVGTNCSNSSMLFLGNHISYLDIPLLLATAPAISFVSKIEISRWPIIGSAAKAINTVFVSRNNLNSRHLVRQTIECALKQGKRIALFPSGTTTMYEEKPWRKGAFEIASNADIWVQPFRISYEPLRHAAYIGNDFFPTHLLKLCCLKKIKAKIEFHPPVKIEADSIQECHRWQSWAADSTKHVKCTSQKIHSFKL